MRSYYMTALIILLALINGCAPLQRMQNRQNYVFDISETEISDTVWNGRISVNNTDNECWIFVVGVITKDATRAFRLAADDAEHRGCLTKWVILESGGGEIRPAMEIGRIVRSRGYNTTIPKIGGKCASSCGLIFISGIRREIPTVLFDSKIGFHQISRKGPDGKKICVEVTSEASKRFLDYAKEMLKAEAAEKFHKNAMETECTAMTYFGPDELVASGIATAIGGPRTF